jgi:fructose-1,6-bisphosphatase II / sedoheptulose-1,7-bisphosphatase
MKNAAEIAFNAIQVTQAAAIACEPWIGRGDGMAADGAAVDAMRNALGAMPISGRIVIGEGERDEAPMLYIGEELGLGGEELDIAVDPLEGTNLCANALPNALTVLAMAKRGNLLHAPDVYMDKIAVGGGLPEGIIDINASVKTNLSALAKARGKDINDMLVVILDRPRHAELIAHAREAGARVRLISDGDVSSIIEAAMGKVDMVIGSGGAPEGVLAAAALRCLGGQMQGRLLFNDDAQKQRAQTMGISDFSKIYSAQELAKGDVIFAATGVTSGVLLKGVVHKQGKITTESICMESATKTIQRIKTTIIA